MSDTCPHCRRLRERVEELEEELRAARAVTASPDLISRMRLHLGLSTQEAELLAVLYRRRETTSATLRAVLDGDGNSRSDNHLFAVFSKLRQKLAPRGIAVPYSRHGMSQIGVYLLSQASRARMAALIGDDLPQEKMNEKANKAPADARNARAFHPARARPA